MRHSKPETKRTFSRVGKEKPGREGDFYAWLLDQAHTLRARKPDFIDWEGIADELEEIAVRTKHALASHLEHLLMHLLKLTFEPSENERRMRERQWKLDVIEHRNRVNDIPGDSLTLLNMFEDLKAKAYARACKSALVAIGERFKASFPAECPWTLEQIQDDDFFALSDSDSNGHSH